MVKKNKNGLTAAQFADLHNINKSTLLYYDEIGLFSPAIKKDNGYRYYTYRQSSQLEMILSFRELGMSIDEIKAYMNEPSREALLHVLEEKIKEADGTIRRMREIKKLLVAREKSLKRLVHTDFSRIELVYYPEEYLLVSSFNDQWTPESEILSVIAHARKFHTHRMFNYAFGTMMCPESIARGRFGNYDGYFTRIEKPFSSKKGDFFIKPEGTYMRAFCVGNWQKIPETYTQMAEYAKKHDLMFLGYAFEEGINEMVAKNVDEYVTQITIAVIPKQPEAALETPMH